MINIHVLCSQHPGIALLSSKFSWGYHPVIVCLTLGIVFSAPQIVWLASSNRVVNIQVLWGQNPDIVCLMPDTV